MKKFVSLHYQTKTITMKLVKEENAVIGKKYYLSPDGDICGTYLGIDDDGGYVFSNEMNYLYATVFSEKFNTMVIPFDDFPCILEIE